MIEEEDMRERLPLTIAEGEVVDPEAEAVTMEVEVGDILRLTEGADLTVEIEPATGSRIVGSHWVATIPVLEVTASEEGLEKTIQRLAFEAVGASQEVVRGRWRARDTKLPVALRVLALDRIGMLLTALKGDEVISEEFVGMVSPPEQAA